jgi:hypothetical protein
MEHVLRFAPSRFLILLGAASSTLNRAGFLHDSEQIHHSTWNRFFIVLRTCSSLCSEHVQSLCRARCASFLFLQPVPNSFREHVSHSKRSWFLTVLGMLEQDSSPCSSRYFCSARDISNLLTEDQCKWLSTKWFILLKEKKNGYITNTMSHFFEDIQLSMVTIFSLCWPLILLHHVRNGFCSRRSRRGLVQEDKRMAFVYTHGLFIN